MNSKNLPPTMKLNVKILVQRTSGAKNKLREAFAAVLGDLLRTSFTVGTESSPCSSSVLSAKQRI